MSASEGRGGRRTQATMEDVAREAGVSRALVSMVFRGVPGVSQARRAAVLEAAERLDYSPNTLASILASHRTSTVGLLINDLHNTVYADVVDGILDVLEPTALHLVFATSAGSGHRERAAMQRLVDMRVDVAMTVGASMPEEDLLRFARRLPTLLITREVESIDSVDSDNRSGTAVAVRHLAGLGHRAIAYIGAPASGSDHPRREGYRAGMAAAGLAPLELDTAAGLAGGAAALQRLRSGGRALPTAVVAYNDATALGVVDAAERAGVAVPARLSVVGYDDTEMAGLHRVGLTTVSLHARMLGRASAEQVLRRLASPELEASARRIVPTLVVRTSTAPPAR